MASEFGQSQAVRASSTLSATRWASSGGTELPIQAIATANDATGDLRATQDFARHAHPETTAIYTRTTDR